MYLAKDIYYLVAGDVYFSEKPIKIQTTLGSCIAITAWNSKLRKGGMCHYLLPYPLPEEVNESVNRPDLYYGIHAINHMKEKLILDSKMEDYEFGLYGGGSLFFSSSHTRKVGRQNVKLVLNWVKEEGVNVVDESLGGDDARTLVMDLATGNIDLNLHSVKKKKRFGFSKTK